MTPHDELDRAEALDSAARHAARLVWAFGWLRVLAEPGREPRPAPALLSDAQRERIAEESASEATDRQANIRAGLSAFPTGAVPVRLEMLNAQARALRAAGRIVRHVGRAYGTGYGDPVAADNLVDALDWLAGDGGPPCWAVDAAGVVRRRNVLGEVEDWRVVDRTATALRDAAEDARAMAGITTERVAPYPNQPCPACRRRSLEIDATLRDERYWTVVCLREACVCAGPGCPCYQHHPREGARHAWSFGELPRLAWAQDVHRRRHPVRAGAAGHGGWAERRQPPVIETGDADA